VLELIAGLARPAALVLNRLPPTGRLAAEINTALTARALPRLRAALGNRVVFAQSFARGLGVTEALPQSPAAFEIRALAAEVRERLGAGGEG
jgi:chromosome partitioning protein